MPVGGRSYVSWSVAADGAVVRCMVCSAAPVAPVLPVCVAYSIEYLIDHSITDTGGTSMMAESLVSVKRMPQNVLAF